MLLSIFFPLLLGGLFIYLSYKSHVRYVNAFSDPAQMTKQKVFLYLSTFVRYGLFFGGVLALHRMGSFDPVNSSIALFVGIAVVGYVCFREDLWK